MKVCCLSDLHGYKPKVENSDIILIAGDLTNSGDYFEMRDFWNYVEEDLIYKAKDIIIIGGNHDFYLEKQKVKPFTKTNPDYNGTIHYLYNSSCVAQGLKFWGTPHTLRFHDWAFNSSEEELYDIFSRCPKDTDVILSHSMPRDILDYSQRDDRLGSVSMKILCDEIKPKLFIGGHLHSGAGQVNLNGTIYVNASYLNDNYKPNEINPTYIEF